MTTAWRAAGALGALWLAGCGAAGPEVRLSPDPGEWEPGRIVLLPALLSGGAVPTGRTLPGGLTAPTPEAAAADVRTALRASLASCATRCAFEPAPDAGRPDTAEAIGKISKQYLDARQTDPEAGRAAGAEWMPDPAGPPVGLLVISVLKYGPEVDEDVSSMSKSVSTTVGTTDVGISSSAQRIVAYLNVHIRCGLIRGSDGVLVWDASARRRVKSAAAGEAGLAGLLDQAVADLCLGWPWRPGRPTATPEPDDEDDDRPAPAAKPSAPAPAAAPEPTPPSATPLR